MPLVLSQNPALLSLQPLAEEVDANKPPVINTYSPDVESWRREVWDAMPPQLRQRPDANTLLDKALYVMEGESGGSDTIPGDGGAAYGLYQSHYISPGSDATTQIKDMWRLVSNNPDSWSDWGQNALYEGKPFGALGRNPYPGDSGGSSGSTAGASIGQQFQQTQSAPNLRGINPNQGGFRDTELTQPVSGGYQTESPLTTLSNVAKPLAMAEEATRGPHIPYSEQVGQAVGNVVDNPFLPSLVSEQLGGPHIPSPNPVEALNLPSRISGAVGGPDLPTVGGVSSAVVPTNTRDALLTAAPMVKPVLSGGKAALESAALKGLEPRPSNVVDFPGGRPAISQVRYPSIAGAAGKPDPADFIRRAREMGMSDEEIRQAFPGALEAAGGIDTAPQVAARTQMEQDAKSAAARRVWNRAFDETHDVEVANEAARRAAAQAPEKLPAQKPNVLATEETASEMAAAKERVRNPQQEAGQPKTEQAGAGDAMQEQQQAAGSGTEEYKGRAPSSSGNPTGTPLEQAVESASNPNIPDQPIPPEQLNMLDDVLGQMSMQDVVTKGPGKLEIPPNTTGAAMKLDAASVAERARLSAEYAKTSGGPQLSEAEFRQQWDNVKTARDGGRRWPENWTQDKINAYQKLEQGLTGNANPNAVGQDVSGGLFPGPLFEEGANVPPSVRPPEGTTLGQQRLNRGLNESAGFPGEGEVVEAAKNLKPDQQASLLNKDWEPGKSIAQTAAEAMTDSINLPRSLQTRFDFSYPFRQGLLFVRRQGEFWDAFGKGLQSFWKDEEWKRAVEAEYMNAPYNPQTLKLTKWSGGNMAQREELFYNRLLDKFPAPMRKVFDASEEAATIFINKLRSDVTNNVARKWLRNGLEATDPEFIQDLNIFGNYVNRATGYGNLGELEKSVGALNTVFYGARRNVAMVQAPGYLFNSSSKVRVEAWKDFLGLFGLGASTLGLAQLSGIGDVNTFNPDSADWGKLKIGGTRIDIWGGYQQTARLVYKIASGEMKGPGDLSVFWKNALPYLGNKLSPQAGAAVSTMPEGVKRAIQPVDRPFKITDALAPLAWQGLVQAIKEDGALAGAIAATGLVGVGSQTYESKTDVRDKVAKELKLGDTYKALDPEQRAVIDNSDKVRQYVKENPSPYDERKAQELGPIDQKEAQAAQAFKENQLSKPWQEIRHDLSIERRAKAESLSNEFSDMFEGFDKTRYDDAVKGYYQTQKFNLDGTVDYDATEAARQDFVKGLKPDEKVWLDESLKVSRESKSPIDQKYLKYIDERKQAGYFDVKADDPDRAKKLVELDRKNPLQDALNWYWKGGTVDTNRVPGLNSPEAISLAMQMDPKRPATYAGLARPVNQSPQTYQAWQDYGTRIQNYYTKTVPAYQDQIAQDMFGVKYAQLPDRASRERVVSNILTQVRRGSPELEAVLQFFGDTADGNGDYVVSAESAPYLRQLVQKYGSQPVKAVNSSGRPSKFLVRE